MFFVFRQVTWMDSCEAQLEAAKENGIPVIAFDSNVAEKKLVKAYQGNR